MSERDGAGGRRYGGRTAEERRQARRDALLDAAYELFGTEGYRNVTIERVCSQARLTARNFYEEFGGREALLLAIYDRTIGRSVEAVAAARSRTPASGPTPTRCSRTPGPRGSSTSRSWA